MTPASRRWGACLVGQFHDMVGRRAEPFFGKRDFDHSLRRRRRHGPKRQRLHLEQRLKIRSGPHCRYLRRLARGSGVSNDGNDALRIYTTTTPTTHRLYTLMHDPIYRMSVATENVAYNQPPEPGIYIGPNMTLPETKPNIKVLRRNPPTGGTPATAALVARQAAPAARLAEWWEGA